MKKTILILLIACTCFIGIEAFGYKLEKIENAGTVLALALCLLCVIRLIQSFCQRSKLPSATPAPSHTFCKQKETTDITALSKEEREKYDESIKVLRDNYAVEQTTLKKGRAEGRAEGLKEGRAEGLKEGRAEGEKMKAIEVARFLKSSGTSVELIAGATGLTEEEINELN